MTKVIVFGNEKGGSGKSTTAVNIMAYLMHQKMKVGVLDLDTRQQSILRFIENRNEYSRNFNTQIAVPETRVIKESLLDSKILAHSEERHELRSVVKTLKSTCDYVLIDCPGSNSNLSVSAHDMADLIVTPINDSFVDFDLLGRIDPNTKRIKHASIYSEIVWNARKARVASNQPSPDWVVLRNRTTHTNSNNKIQMERSLQELSRRCGFKIVHGFSERTIFRELFTCGLTLLDMSHIKNWTLTLSHINARNEVRNLVKSLGINEFTL